MRTTTMDGELTRLGVVRLLRDLDLPADRLRRLARAAADDQRPRPVHGNVYDLAAWRDRRAARLVSAG